MKRKHETIKIRTETRDKIRLLSALMGIPMLEVVDSIASQKLEKVKKLKKIEDK